MSVRNRGSAMVAAVVVAVALLLVAGVIFLGGYDSGQLKTASFEYADGEPLDEDGCLESHSLCITGAETVKSRCDRAAYRTWRSCEERARNNDEQFRCINAYQNDQERCKLSEEEDTVACNEALQECLERSDGIEAEPEPSPTPVPVVQRPYWYYWWWW